MTQGSPHLVIIRNPCLLRPSLSCAIELDSKVIVTGGDNAPRQVSVYTLAGWAADLPSLRTSRWLHACGHFVNSEDKQVSR